MEERNSVGKERTQDNIIMRKKKANCGEKKERREWFYFDKEERKYEIRWKREKERNITLGKKGKRQKEGRKMPIEINDGKKEG
jgi:hypothetical protein